MTPTDHNVEAEEIDKFSVLAHRWWDEHGEFRPLHLLNPHRLRWIQDHVGLGGKAVVDIGCGGGILSESMAAAGAKVTGIDLADASLQVARLHALDAKFDIDYRLVSAERLATEAAGQFDIVTCMEMLEHVPDPASIIQASAALVRPGGWVFVSTLNRNAKAYLFAILGAEYLLRLLPKGTHDYAKFLQPSEISAMGRRCGLETADIAGLEFQPLTQRFRITHDPSVNYLMALRRPL
ncbi:MAG: bifunctional 2-polyprenyl-6-hydroxyphenol methylase/3-demethylubiquinol 3-O-methyltransferase UbiG [Thiomonas sp.]|jgi:2-polyprenyl-6-hydroxyphenyl methylase/3-demethylubiquinone-9 3-methyltransferase|uniref:bifunctional 2-polyprenyl-6-hydroxyphenol methylase/3-demethylubiquinol 3-O-methyltransferase UbiG n=1 Tax=Thiomonas arsenitoxydans (strain DSM 22701 / CIP 110005 / 3As) TaxID=426114 RepID=UPI001AD32B21|nr:bifunctional 2-polyprenyl-6-hydroxyphenol methylase/3-demethylubiquinol 3-O-methyltransferase UbiG [Thiomonas arsenitoxydans]MBN8777830.1 bifunctional 2-polyprenyl-6-hydroxyphenol methylase/3-demethylubiquinol 3-O-methyltransferase UbiG [Thiomonas arsenitoxydans]MDE2270293.1 bifunctional 2-polyprenyl-6-hydroxyphenol methylase/3-demethylubiquinol 3-O-methyltransferase UbiG [Betaproteobacteria bacterium]